MIQQGLNSDERFRHRAEFLSAAPTLGTRCFFAVMDGDRNQKYVRQIGLKFNRGFYFFRFGKMTHIFNGPFTTTHYENFALSKTGLPFTSFEDYISAQDFIESTDNAIVLYLQHASGLLFEKFSTLSSQYRDNYSFGLCPDEYLADELGIDLIPSMVLYRSKDRARVFYPDSIESATSQDILAWLQYQKKPRFETFSLEDQRMYQKGKPVILFFVPVDDIQRETTLDLVSKLAIKYDEDLTFTQIDAVSGNRYMIDIGFSKYADPAVAIIEYKLDVKYHLYPEEADWSFDDLCRFIENFLDRRIS